MNLDELSVLEKKASPGPWSYNGHGGYVCFMQITDGKPTSYVSAPQSPGMHRSYLDASFIAASRTALPLLIEVAKEAAEIPHDSWCGHGNADKRLGWCDCNRRELSAALAALEEAK